MLSANAITVRFDAAEVLRDVTFELATGEIAAILGPNGAGKSTLLRTLNGQVLPGAGEVLLDGKPLGDLSRREIARRIAVVAQENETKFPVTVLEYVLAGRFARGRAFGWESDADLAAAQKAIEKCDLADRAASLMNELSGGERQRAVFARAIAADTAILLLDEPTANLDLAHQGSLFRLLRDRCRGGEYAAVAVTHDLNLASEFADRVVLMRGGRIVAAGTPDMVLNEENLRCVFGVDVLLDRNPASGSLRVTTIY
jgi:iron complex transport system ATP-binding protein